MTEPSHERNADGMSDTGRDEPIAVLPLSAQRRVAAAGADAGGRIGMAAMLRQWVSLAEQLEGAVEATESAWREMRAGLSEMPAELIDSPMHTRLLEAFGALTAARGGRR